MSSALDTDESLTAPVADQYAFVASLLQRQDQVLNDLDALAKRIESVIEEVNRSRETEQPEETAAPENDRIDQVYPQAA